MSVNCRNYSLKFKRRKHTLTCFHILLQFSYFQIYNEKVQDLLSAGTKMQLLKVRENPKDGPYVESKC